jgi:hypothetical protein
MKGVLSFNWKLILHNIKQNEEEKKANKDLRGKISI